MSRNAFNGKCCILFDMNHPVDINTFKAAIDWTFAFAFKCEC